jgi:hypothetical protein
MPMRRPFALTLALLLAVPLAALASERRTVTKTYPVVRHDDVDVDVRIGEAKIESFRIQDWPDHEKIEKGERDHDDTTSVNVVFTYTSKDHEHDYKCRYSVAFLADSGKVLGEGESERTLDKGKKHDTNRVSVGMKTYRYGKAKKVRVTYDMREKD